ncbi:MAG: MaoC family dehydratase N-terminal domain-containing protein [Acetobacteraceae bacterium]|nr:MaoC family dehydratase N-terminal domain-containing protein [Acetobacteraceae bacterium]
MAIDVDRLLNWPFEDVVQRYDARDAMFYALSVGLCADPMDERELRYVYEKDLAVFPTLPAVLCHPGPWMADPRSGIDRSKVVHGEQRVVLHRRPLPTAATVRGRTRVVGVVDKGEGRGALIYQERRLVDDATGEPLATLLQTSFARADGGFGGPREAPVPALEPVPDATPPDVVAEMPTFANQALFYRLNADRNPLHAEPAVARRAGFERPILHGMCTFAVAAHAVLKTVGGYDPASILDIEARFSAPVFPGETISVEMWRQGRTVRFRASVPTRGTKVLDHGRVTLAG